MTERKIRVLLIEDDEDDYLITRDLFGDIANGRYALRWCDTYVEGRIALLSGQYDVCLLDHRLDGRTGLELLREVRDLGLAQPIILVTGHADHQTDMGAMHAGADDFMVKEHLNPTLLERSIRYAMERRATMQALRISEERYALAARGAGAGLWDWDLRANEVYFSASWKHLLGLDEADVLDPHIDTWYARVHGDDTAKLRHAIEGHLDGRSSCLEFEHRLLHRDGGYRWFACHGLALRDQSGKAYRMAGSLMDVTNQYIYDALTGLPNYLLFKDRIAHSLTLAAGGGTARFCAVLLIDLDRIKLLNESLGYSLGDKLIAAFASRLRQTMLTNTTIGRLHGQQFGVLLENVVDSGDVARIARRIQQVMQAPFSLGDHEVFVTTGIGIALNDKNYSDALDILRDAGTALRRAKSIGRDSCVIFDESMQASAIAVLQLEADLRRAVVQQEFSLNYQPIIRISDGGLAGLEVLVRWQVASDSFISPGVFIPVAEDTGLIYIIGQWVLRAACQQLKAWQDQGLGEGIYISVNLSGRQLSHPDLFNSIKSVLDDTGLSAADLRFEITESAIMNDPEAAIELLRRIRALGIGFSIDDFGTGYSSFSYLQRLPVDSVKVDRSFVANIETDQDNLAICSTIITLAHTLKLSVVAEGIEDQHQHAVLKGLACDYGQGYHYARPVQAEVIQRQWLEQPQV